MIPSDRPAIPDPEIDALLVRHPMAPPAAPSADAAVLIVLRRGPVTGAVETLLIQRTDRADDTASGQVSLPGGRVDAADQTLADTAIREAEEEVGLGPKDLAGRVRYVGQRHAVAFGLNVGIFAAALAPASRTASVQSPSEVADVFWMPLAELANVRSVPRATSVGSREVEAAVHDGFVVWGFTRRVLREFYGIPERPSGTDNPLPMPRPVRKS